MNKVLIVETNIKRYENTDEATGLWLGESAEFVDELKNMGLLMILLVQRVVMFRLTHEV